jgi:hypothetical protein
MQQNSSLTHVGDLARDISSSYERRVQIVNEIVQDTQKMLDDFRKKREAMSQELRDILAKSENLRKKDFSRMMEDIVLTQQRREENVKRMLEDFREEESLVAKNLRMLLAKGGEVRIRDFKKMLAKIKEEQGRREKETAHSVTIELATMQKEVGEMLNNFKRERAVMASEWGNIAMLLTQKRAATDL